MQETILIKLGELVLKGLNRKIFEAVGFDVEPLGSNTVMLNSVPAALPEHRDLSAMIPDMLQELVDNEEHKLPVELEYVARAACRTITLETA